MVMNTNYHTSLKDESRFNTIFEGYLSGQEEIDFTGETPAEQEDSNEPKVSIYSPSKMDVAEVEEETPKSKHQKHLTFGLASDDEEIANELNEYVNFEEFLTGDNPTFKTYDKSSKSCQQDIPINLRRSFDANLNSKHIGRVSLCNISISGYDVARKYGQKTEKKVQKIIAFEKTDQRVKFNIKSDPLSSLSITSPRTQFKPLESPRASNKSKPSSNSSKAKPGFIKSKINTLLEFHRIPKPSIQKKQDNHLTNIKKQHL